jgi:hypothetical protein
MGAFTNYDALLAQIYHSRKGSEPVALVTFNQDTLLENALNKQFRMMFEVLNDCVSRAGDKAIPNGMRATFAACP